MELDKIGKRKIYDKLIITLNSKDPKFSGQLESSRNYGIDLLRVLSMFYVLVLHTLGQGGVLGGTVEGSRQYMFSWFLEIWAYGAVDIFALISGYVSYTEREKKVHYSNYVILWFQVVVYGVIVTLLFKLIHPGLVAKYDLIQMIFPVTNGLYWYFTAYTGLFIVMPLLDAGLRKCSQQFLKKMFVLIIIVFSVIGTVADRFSLMKGYSFVWLVILYILGAIIKKCDIGRQLKAYEILLAILSCCIIGWDWNMFGVEFNILNISITKSLLVSYTSPTVLVASMLHVIGFSKLKISSNIGTKSISFFATGAFAAYILNCQKFIWYEIGQRFAYLGDKNLIVIFLHIIAFSFSFLIGSIVIDHIRIWLFKILRIRELAEGLVTLADKILSGKNN